MEYVYPPEARDYFKYFLANAHWFTDVSVIFTERGLPRTGVIWLSRRLGTLVSASVKLLGEEGYRGGDQETVEIWRDVLRSSSKAGTPVHFRPEFLNHRRSDFFTWKTRTARRVAKKRFRKINFSFPLIARHRNYSCVREYKREESMKKIDPTFRTRLPWILFYIGKYLHAWVRVLF